MHRILKVINIFSFSGIEMVTSTIKRHETLKLWIWVQLKVCERRDDRWKITTCLIKVFVCTTSAVNFRAKLVLPTELLCSSRSRSKFEAVWSKTTSPLTFKLRVVARLKNDFAHFTFSAIILAYNNDNFWYNFALTNREILRK